MRVLGLINCVLLFLTFMAVSALPYPGPGRDVQSPHPVVSSISRRIRALEEPKKDDLEGSESAFVAYPYYGIPYAAAYNYHVPVVYYVGK